MWVRRLSSDVSIYNSFDYEDAIPVEIRDSNLKLWYKIAISSKNKEYVSYQFPGEYKKNEFPGLF